MSHEYAVNDNSSVYYSGRYWDEYAPVARYLNTIISGHADWSWDRHFAERHGRTFERALVLNCGNGRVERGLLELGLIKEAVGIDYADDLLDQARSAAAQGDFSARYHRMDVNTADFPDEYFDLIVNVGACHHIAYIDRVFRALCARLPRDGWFVSFDYVGPHRNQYRSDAWEVAWELNRTLPEGLRQELDYPHLPTMLASDPTEAIHSELVVETFRRYFIEDENISLGGAVAYPLLTHNEPLYAASDIQGWDVWIERIIAADSEFLRSHPDSSLFAFFTGQPKEDALKDSDQLGRWSAEEDDRETRAAACGGEYYPHTALQAAYLALEERRWTGEHWRIQLAQVQAELEAIQNGIVYSAVHRLSESRLAKALCKRPTVVRLVRWFHSRRDHHNKIDPFADLR